jgi:tellurite resistance protein TerC
LHYGLSAILILVGGKMLASHYYEIPTVLALGAVAIILAASVVASLMRPQRQAH